MHTTPDTRSAKKLAADDELHEELWLDVEEITQALERTMELPFYHLLVLRKPMGWSSKRDSHVRKSCFGPFIETSSVWAGK